jgi:hypothetical protein
VGTNIRDGFFYPFSLQPFSTPFPLDLKLILFVYLANVRFHELNTNFTNLDVDTTSFFEKGTVNI